MPAPQPSPAPRLLFFGLGGQLSARPLAALLAAGWSLAGAVMPAAPTPAAAPLVLRPPPARAMRTLPLHGAAAGPVLPELAWQHGAPVLAVSRLDHPAILAGLATPTPDLIAVACFPWRLPSALLALARLGGINLHPSPLPRGRGPAPRFWTFRHGWATGAVTVHQMTEQLDAGPILGQTHFALPDGLTGDQLDALVAEHGAPLLVRAAHELLTGTARPQPQAPALATYDPWPTAADYRVTPDRPARWAYNFIRGVADDGGRLTLAVAGQHWPIVGALAYEATAEQTEPVQPAGAHRLWIQCRPGRLLVEVGEPDDGPMPYNEPPVG